MSRVFESPTDSEKCSKNGEKKPTIQLRSSKKSTNCLKSRCRRCYLRAIKRNIVTRNLLKEEKTKLKWNQLLTFAVVYHVSENEIFSITKVAFIRVLGDK